MLKAPNTRQLITLIVGLAAWAASQYLPSFPTTGAWYSFQFAFPLGIGITLGWWNKGGPIGPLILLAAVLGMANFAFQAIVNGPLDLRGWSFVAAFTMDCFFSAFVLNQSRTVVLLTNQVAELNSSITPQVADVAPSFEGPKWTDTLVKLTPAIAAIVGLMTALLNAVVHKK
ncbi:MAG: hypothetical protein JWQ49_4862 [Edaphobacter sp.]|nr:hypothetical protein [Edaphobacter sp.]